MPSLSEQAEFPPPELIAREPLRDNQLRAEAIELARARNLLDTNRPADALGVLSRSPARLTSNGLAPEREALLIEALLRLGRTEQARERAESFLFKHPESPLNGRIRELVGLRVIQRSR